MGVLIGRSGDPMGKTLTSDNSGVWDPKWMRFSGVSYTNQPDSNWQKIFLPAVMEHGVLAVGYKEG